MSRRRRRKKERKKERKRDNRSDKRERCEKKRKKHFVLCVLVSLMAYQLAMVYSIRKFE